MGYRTEFSFSYSTGDGKEHPELPPDVIAFIKNSEECEAIGLENVEILYAFDGNDSKWYDYDQDMKTLSCAFPQYMFILFGVGEESFDVWRKAYRDGKVVHSEVIKQLPKLSKKLLTFKTKG